MTLSIQVGRCRSGRRWFWTAYRTDWDDSDGCEQVYGWEDTEEMARERMTEAAVRFGAEVDGVLPGHHVHEPWGERRERWARPRPECLIYERVSYATDALKRINAEKRRSRPAPDTADAGAVEYLYANTPWWNEDGPAEFHRPITEITEFRITKKTPKRVYYVVSEPNGKEPQIGFVDRETLERDGEVYNLGRHWCMDDYHLFATREAAEGRSYAEEEPDVRELRLAAAAAHPDRGGSNEEFTEAFARYERALRAK
jgi:hypothetical protein